MAGKNVLLVDDEEEYTSTLAERMEKRGVNVDIASNGIDAIEKASKKFYDAILLDLKMPGMDGIETLKRLRTINPDLQVILLTGCGTIEKGIESVRLGAMDFLEKPADIQKLMEKIGAASDNKMLLVEKREEENIQNLLKAKGW